MSGPVDSWNIVQASLEANRIKGVQESQFQNIQGFMWIRMAEEDRRKRTQVIPSEKPEDGRVEGDAPREQPGVQSRSPNRDPDDPRGGVLDIKA